LGGGGEESNIQNQYRTEKGKTRDWPRICSGRGKDKGRWNTPTKKVTREKRRPQNKLARGKRAKAGGEKVGREGKESKGP